MSDSSDDISEREHRIIRGVWQPRNVEPKDRIDPSEAAPKGRLVQCFIVKDPVSHALCLFLQLSPQLSITNQGKFLLVGREISHVSHSEFSIWNDLDDLSEDSDFLIGKLLSNLSRTEYVLHDYRLCGTAESHTSCWRPHHGARPGSRRVAEVHYNMTLGKPQQFSCVIHTITFSERAEDGFVGPIRAPDLRTSRRIFAEELHAGKSGSDQTPSGSKHAEAAEPTLDKSASWAGQSQPKLADTTERSKSESAMQFLQPSSGWKHGGWKGSKEDLTKIDRDEELILKTSAYQWDDTQKRYYAKFKGRDNVQGSSKNFQMVIGNESGRRNGETLLQFGEVSAELYFMDYAYPLSAFEAFGICLTRLD